MFQTALPTTTIFEASCEIGIILAGTFILGLMMGWILKPNSKGVDILEVMPEVKPSYVRAKKIEKVSTATQAQDLTLIDGLTPKVIKLLWEKWVKSFEDIVEEDVAGLEVILSSAGASFKNISPVTWPDQARLAIQHKWSELEEYQEILRGGK